MRRRRAQRSPPKQEQVGSSGRRRKRSKGARCPGHILGTSSTTSRPVLPCCCSRGQKSRRRCCCRWQSLWRSTVGHCSLDQTTQSGTGARRRPTSCATWRSYTKWAFTGANATPPPSPCAGPCRAVFRPCIHCGACSCRTSITPWPSTPQRVIPSFSLGASSRSYSWPAQTACSSTIMLRTRGPRNSIWRALSS